MPSKVSHESTEDYLETILILQRRNHIVRSIDIVNEMNFSKPSISIAMKKLREQGLVEMDQNGHISLLPPGREACRIEHVIDDDTYNKINAFYEKFMKEQA